MRVILKAAMLVLLLPAALGSCGGGGGDGSSSLSQGDGTVRILLTDSPVDDADAVFIMIDRIEVVPKGDGPPFVVNDTDQEVDLLTLQNGVTMVIGEGAIPPGDYEGVRLVILGGQPGGGPPPRPVGDNRIVIGGEEFRLVIPSGSHSGLKLKGAFTIAEGTLTELLVEFNVRHSIVKLGHKDEYLLKPRLRLIASNENGAFEGTVTDVGTGSPIEGAAVSAQQGGSEVSSVLTGADGTYRIGPIAPGTYDIVASAPGYAPAALDGVSLAAGVIVSGQDFALSPSETGSISGTTVTDMDAEIHLVWQGHFLALVGPDSTTGEFSFAGVAVGTYDVVLFLGGEEVARADSVEVLANTDTGGITLTPP